MRNPYQRDNGPSRVGGDPLKNIVGGASGVQGQQVQPGKAKMSEKAAGVMKQGRGSSYTVSSGLVNALDVVKGVTQVMGGVNSYMDASDQYNQGKMEKELNDLTSAPTWTDNEADGYLDPDQKNTALNEVYKKYEGVWNRNKAEAWFDGKRTGTNIQYQQQGYEREMSAVNLTAAKMESKGELAEAAAHRQAGYELLRKKYADDPTRMTQIDAADLSAGAMWATAVNESVDTLVNSWTEGGGMSNFVQTQPTDIGYEEWRQAGIADMVANDPGGVLGDMFYQSYDQSTGEFTGAYAGQVAAQMDAKLKPMYAKAVNQRTAIQQDSMMAGMAAVPKQITSRVNAAPMSDPGARSVIFSQGIAQVISTTEGLPSAMTPGQKYQHYLTSMEQSIGGIYKQNPAIKDDAVADMVDQTFEDNGASILAGIAPGMDPESDEGKAKLAGMSDAAKASLRAARTAAGTKINNEADKEIQDSVTTTNDQETLQAIVDRNPFVKLAKGESTSEAIHFLDENGQPFTGPQADAYLRRAQKAIVAGALMRGDSPQDTLAAQKEFTAKYKAWREGKGNLTPDLLYGALDAAFEGTPFQGQGDAATGQYAMSWDASVGGNVEQQGLAQIAAILPHLRLDQKTGFYDPLDKVNQTEINKVAEQMTRSIFRGDGTLSRENLEVLPGVVNRFRTVFEPAVANRAVASALVGQVAVELGYELDSNVLRNATNIIERELKGVDGTTDPIAMENVHATLDQLLKRRSGLIEIANTPEFVANANISQEAKDIIFGSFGLETGTNAEGQPYARPRGNGQDTWGLGWTFFNDVEGIDDAWIQPIQDNLSTGDLQTIIGLGQDAGLWDTSDGTLRMSKGAKDDPAGARRQLAIAMRQGGMEIEFDTSQESGWFEFDDNAPFVGRSPQINGVRVQNAQQSWQMLPDGRFVPSNTQVDGMGGASFQDDMARGMATREESWMEWAAEGIQDVTAGVIAGPFADSIPYVTPRDASRGDVFEANIEAQGVARGRSKDSTRRWMDKPVNRQILADHARPARNIFMSETATAERAVLANQMEATMESLSAAGVVLDNQEVVDLVAIQTQLRSGTMPPNGPLWKKTVEVAKAQGYDPSNPPMWATKVAILAMMMPDEEDALINGMHFMDMNADRGYVAAATPGSELPANRRGYTEGVRYSFENLPEGNRLSTGKFDLPIMGAATVRDIGLGDPRTLMSKNKTIRPSEIRERNLPRFDVNELRLELERKKARK